MAGPFTSAQIKRDIILGRIRQSELLSPDGVHWSPLENLAEFSRLGPATPGSPDFIRCDERVAERRGDDAEPEPAAERRRRGPDRRSEEPAVMRERRMRSGRVWKSLAPRRPRSVMAWLLVAGVSAIALYLAVNLPSGSVASPDCTARAAPRVNWSSCHLAETALRRADLRGASLHNADLSASDLAGANLGGTDLAYANLSGAHLTLANFSAARLVGANLRGADLRHANLRDADLRYADLRSARIEGADLGGARLSSAIWTGGQACKAGSHGACRQ